MSKKQIANLAVKVTASSEGLRQELNNDAEEIKRFHKRARQGIDTTNDAVNAGQRSMRLYYQTQSRSAARGFIEQQTRDEMAARIRAMRAESMRAKVGAEVSQRLFGGPVAVDAAEKSGEDLAGHQGKGFLKELQMQFGRSSSFAKTMKLMAGTGPIYAIHLATKMFAEMAEGAAHAADQFRAGKLTTGELADNLAGSVPLIGEIWKGGRAIREAFTGEQAAIEATLKAAEALNEATAFRAELAQKVKASEEATARAVEDLALRRAKLGASADKQAELDTEARDRREKEDAAKRLDEQIKEIRDKARAKADELGAKASEYISEGSFNSGTDYTSQIQQQIQQVRSDAARAIKQLESQKAAILPAIDMTQTMEGWARSITSIEGKVIGFIDRFAAKAKEARDGAYSEADRKRKTTDERDAEQWRIKKMHQDEALRIADEGKRAYDAALGSGQAYINSIEELQRLHQQGGLTDEQYKVAALKATVDYQAGQPQNFDAPAQQRFTTYRVEWNQKTETAAEKQLREAQQSKALLQQINEAIRSTVAGEVAQF
jgi:hypothetical protein